MNIHVKNAAMCLTLKFGHFLILEVCIHVETRCSSRDTDHITVHENLHAPWRNTLYKLDQETTRPGKSIRDKLTGGWSGRGGGGSVELVSRWCHICPTLLKNLSNSSLDNRWPYSIALRHKFITLQNIRSVKTTWYLSQWFRSYTNPRHTQLSRNLNCHAVSLPVFGACLQNNKKKINVLHINQ